MRLVCVCSCACMRACVVVVVVVVCRVSEQGEVHPAGHMQPLGSHKHNGRRD